MDVNEALEQYGKRESSDVARHLRESSTRAALEKRVGGRRRRHVVSTVGGSVAVVAIAVVAIGAIAGGGQWSTEPAGVPIDDGEPQGFPPYYLWGVGDAPIQCAFALDVEPGALAHDTHLLFELPEGDVPNGGFVILPGVRPIVETGTVVSAEAYAAEGAAERADTTAWAWSMEAELSEPVLVAATSVAVQNGVVVGVEPVATVGGELDGLSDRDLFAATPGDCGEGQGSVAFEAGGYTVHFLIQIWDQSGSTLRATITDPIEPLVRTTAGGEAMAGEPPEPELAEATEGLPQQAFVVPRPVEESCTPFADQRAAQLPSPDSVSYWVNIPPFEEVTGEWWGSEPVFVVEDETFNPWYLGLDAWLVADSVSAGNPSAGVGWTRESNWGEPESDDVGVWRLLAKAGPGAPPASADDCAFEQPIPELSGFVWLVIDGVDWESLEAENPGVDLSESDLITWVYLGDA